MFFSVAHSFSSLENLNSNPDFWTELSEKNLEMGIMRDLNMGYTSEKAD